MKGSQMQQPVQDPTLYLAVQEAAPAFERPPLYRLLVLNGDHNYQVKSLI